MTVDKKQKLTPFGKFFKIFKYWDVLRYRLREFGVTYALTLLVPFVKFGKIRKDRFLLVIGDKRILELLFLKSYLQDLWLFRRMTMKQSLPVWTYDFAASVWLENFYVLSNKHIVNNWLGNWLMSSVMFHDQEYFSHIYITIACKRKFGPDDTMDRGIYIKYIYIYTSYDVTVDSYIFGIEIFLPNTVNFFSRGGEWYDVNNSCLDSFEVFFPNSL